MFIWFFVRGRSLAKGRMNQLRESDLWRRCAFWWHFGFFPKAGKPGHSALESPLEKQARKFKKVRRRYRVGRASLCDLVMKRLNNEGRREWNKYIRMHQLACAFYPSFTSKDPLFYFPHQSGREELVAKSGARIKRWHRMPYQKKPAVHRQVR